MLPRCDPILQSGRQLGCLKCFTFALTARLDMIGQKCKHRNSQFNDMLSLGGKSITKLQNAWTILQEQETGSP
jgi:hypothetical protein